MSRRLAAPLSRPPQLLISPVCRSFCTTLSRSSDVPKPLGFVQSLLHGSAEAQAVESQQHSKLVGRGKYAHELIKHRVRPDSIEEYTAAAEKYFGSMKIREDGGGCELMGSWQTVVGELDTFVHIVRHPSLRELSTTLITPVPPPPTNPYLISRESSLLQEFAFWPAKDNPKLAEGEEEAKVGDNVFELRSYELIPGTMLEWEGAWRKGIEARKRFINPAGAWFTQVGHLHTVHHLWAYADMEARKMTREKAWSVSGWADTVKQTVKLAKGMTSQILVPMSWSPLK